MHKYTSQRLDGRLVEICTAMSALHTKTNMISTVLDDWKTCKLKRLYILQECHIAIILAPLLKATSNNRASVINTACNTWQTLLQPAR